MSLLSLIVILVVFVFIMWLLSHYVTPSLPPPWGVVVLALVALAMIVVLLNLIGLTGGLNQPIRVR